MITDCMTLDQVLEELESYGFTATPVPISEDQVNIRDSDVYGWSGYHHDEPMNESHMKALLEPFLLAGRARKLLEFIDRRTAELIPELTTSCDLRGNIKVTTMRHSNRILELIREALVKGPLAQDTTKEGK